MFDLAILDLQLSRQFDFIYSCFIGPEVGVCGCGGFVNLLLPENVFIIVFDVVCLSSLVILFIFTGSLLWFGFLPLHKLFNPQSIYDVLVLFSLASLRLSAVELDNTFVTPKYAGVFR